MGTHFAPRLGLSVLVLIVTLQLYVTVWLLVLPFIDQVYLDSIGKWFPDPYYGILFPVVVGVTVLVIVMVFGGLVLVKAPGCWVERRLHLMYHYDVHND